MLEITVNRSEYLSHSDYSKKFMILPPSTQINLYDSIIISGKNPDGGQILFPLIRKVSSLEYIKCECGKVVGYVVSLNK
jgi:hypothetical protein